MNKIISKLLSASVLILLLDSCSILNTVFPKRKDNYINYNTMFATDDDIKKATANSQDQIRMDGKVRIITINKITHDTIVEWVDPIELTGGKKTVFSTKPKSANAILDTAFTTITKQSEILSAHSAIVFLPSDGGTSFQTRNDTLFVSTNADNMQTSLLTLLNRNSETITIIKKEDPIIVVPKLTTRDKINKRVKLAAQKKMQKKLLNQTNTTKSKITPNRIDSTNKPILLEPKLDASIPSDIVLINNNRIVGDIDFDMDASAEIIADEKTILEFVQLQAKQWATLKCKAKVKLKTPDENKFFYANFRMKKNTNTWASINLPIVGELARVSATPDTVAMLDKWKDKYYYYNASELQNILHIPIAYDAIQNYILGDAPMQSGMQIIGKKSKKGTAIKILQAGISCLLTYNVDSTLKTVIVIGNTNGKSYTIKHELSEYENTEHGKFSTKRLIYYIQGGKETSIQLDINKFEFDQVLDFPFSVPAHFVDGNKEKLKK